jgi:putative hemolysin
MFLISSLLIVAFLIALNALYVAAEFAAVGVRRTRVQQLADEGSGAAARLLSVIDEPAALDRYIAACQVGITVSSLVLGAFGEASLAPPLAAFFIDAAGWSQAAAYSMATLLVLVLLTTAQMVLGELLPKAVALRFPVRTAMSTVAPLTWSLRAFSLPIKVLNGSGLRLLGLFGVKHAGARHVHSPKEIAFLLSESSAGGLLAPEALRRLHNALHLGTRTAAELMVPREQIVAISIDAQAEEVLRLAAESPYTRLPVYRGTLDAIEGVLHTKDVLMAQIDRGRLSPEPVRRLMRAAVTAPASTPADQLLVRFREQRSQQALVTGEGGRVVGLVTLEDALAELFGELSDEFKTRRMRPRAAPPAPAPKPKEGRR